MNKIKKTIIIILIIFNLYPGSVFAETDSEKYGNVLRILIPAIGLSGTVLFEEDSEGSLQFFKSLIASQLVTEGLKHSINKKRPNGEDSKSFPSGHTSSAFMGAGFIHKRYNFKYAIPAYLCAIYTGYSRVQADKHYIEDVAAGAVIGVFSSFYFTKQYKGISISPTNINGNYGIKLNKSW